LPSPGITGTSPSGSRLTLSLGSPKSPNWPAPASPTTPVASRRKSSFGLGKKNKEEVLKLPKEFLMEFWNTLAAEEGDGDWSDTVATFLGMIKKGTKTPSGLNLREIPTLLDGESHPELLRARDGGALIDGSFLADDPFDARSARSPIPLPATAVQLPPPLDILLAHCAKPVRQGPRSAVPPPSRSANLHARQLAKCCG
jgi:hypothetical protein